jgi:hypothetical protein
MYHHLLMQVLPTTSTCWPFLPLQPKEESKAMFTQQHCYNTCITCLLGLLPSHYLINMLKLRIILEPHLAGLPL